MRNARRVITFVLLSKDSISNGWMAGHWWSRGEWELEGSCRRERSRLSPARELVKGVSVCRRATWMPEISEQWSRWA